MSEVSFSRSGYFLSGPRRSITLKSLGGPLGAEAIALDLQLWKSMVMSASPTPPSAQDIPPASVGHFRGHEAVSRHEETLPDHR